MSTASGVALFYSLPSLKALARNASSICPLNIFTPFWSAITSVCYSVSFIFAIKFDLGHVLLGTTVSAATSFGSYGSRFSKSQFSNHFRLTRDFPENGPYTSYNHVT